MERRLGRPVPRLPAAHEERFRWALWSGSGGAHRERETRCEYAPAVPGDTTKMMRRQRAEPTQTPEPPRPRAWRWTAGRPAPPGVPTGASHEKGGVNITHECLGPAHPALARRVPLRRVPLLRDPAAPTPEPHLGGCPRVPRPGGAPPPPSASASASRARARARARARTPPHS